MRKIIVLLLCIILTGGAAAHAALDHDWLEYTTPVTDTRQEPAREGLVLTVGAATPMSGCFATDLWGVNTADLDVRHLLHGYQTVDWADGRPWLNGTVVRHVGVHSAADGAQVFTIEITEGLTYNDGTPVTAEDYVFSLLLEASPAVDALGGVSRDLRYIPGYDDYHSGEKALFSGVYLFSPTSFALEIAESALSNFYGPELLMVTPYPIAVIAPGYSVMDDGEGAFLVRNEVPYGLTTELLAETLLNPADGYARNPRVTSGPYTLIDFDLIEGRASFAVNPRFAGDAWGHRPSIDKLVFLTVNEADAARKLSAGEIGLMNKAFSPAVLESFNAVAGISETVYSRSGLAYLAFATEREPVSDPAVRKAIAMVLDREALVRGQPGLERVYGYYGPGQWMAEIVTQDEATVLPALDIPFDPPGANRLLDTTRWSATDADGQRRHDAETRAPLRFVFARSAQSNLADLVEDLLREGMERIGAELLVLSLPFEELLAQFYHQNERIADMYFLASEFPAAFNPLDTFSEGDVLLGYHDSTSVRDMALTADARAMLNAGFLNRADYVTAWLSFQRRFVEALPMIPLYSGAYHDYYTADLLDYDVAAYGSWARAIVPAYLR